MANEQLRLSLNPLKVGDLVKENYPQEYNPRNNYKTVGVVIKMDNHNLDQSFAVEVHWLNYGKFWTIAERLVKVNKDDKEEF